MYLNSFLPFTTLSDRAESKGIQEESYVLSQDTGMSGFFEYTVLDGIEINYSSLSVTEETSFEAKSAEKCIEMHFSLSGKFMAKSEFLQKPVEITQLQHNLFSMPSDLSTNLIFQVAKQPVVKFDILFDQAYFEQILNEECVVHRSLLNKINRNEMMLGDRNYLNISPLMLSVLSDIMACKRKGYFKRLYLEAKVMELFLLQTELLQERQTGKGSDYSLKFSEDIDKLYYVKELIDQEPETEHSLASLSRLAGLNVFKLKNGFKSIFGDTVFGYINELKMAKAKTMLLEEKKQVNEVAYLLGYNSPNNFSTAFKRKYGINPGKLKF
ncbi:AraC family transcriptional regulator [Pedobacter sp. L105]|uniref:helix-turn-helix domain-containing protein n=1 Tax=Pedobacter sp. L105 TaxID=1641871 RepID=UPI00131E5C3F|nr:AraC family transcriptional regulator [Pedobacter sp. L105]